MAPNINTRSTGGHVGVSEVKIHIINCETPSRATTVVSIRHRKNAHCNQRGPGRALTYCGSNRSPVLSALAQTREWVRPMRQCFEILVFLCVCSCVLISGGNL